MATVRVTRELKHGVRGEIRSMFDKLLTDIRNNIRQHSDSLYEAMIPAEHRQYMNLLPANYFDVNRESNIYLRAGDYEISVTVMYSEPKRIPKCYSHSASTRTVDLLDPMNAQLATVLIPLIQEYKAVEGKCKALMDHADTLMENNGTVGMIVKAWPQFVEVLPSWAKTKHFEVTEKKSRTVTALDDDVVAELNTSLMVGKLAG